MRTPRHPPPDAGQIAMNVYRALVEERISAKAASVKARNNAGYVRDIIYRGKSVNPKTEEFRRLADALNRPVSALTGAPDADQAPFKIAEKIADEQLLSEGIVLDIWRMLDINERRRAVVFMIGMFPKRPE